MYVLFTFMSNLDEFCMPTDEFVYYNDACLMIYEHIEFYDML